MAAGTWNIPSPADIQGFILSRRIAPSYMQADRRPRDGLASDFFNRTTKDFGVLKSHAILSLI
jgi:hypothetical protein